jgi:hypothetical protein
MTEHVHSLTNCAIRPAATTKIGYGRSPSRYTEVAVKSLLIGFIIVIALAAFIGISR